MYTVKFVYYCNGEPAQVLYQYRGLTKKDAEDMATADGYDVDYDPNTCTYYVDCGDCDEDVEEM